MSKNTIVLYGGKKKLMNWPPVGVVWVWVGGNYMNIVFLGHFQGHSQIFSICNMYFLIHIQIALEFSFPKHTWLVSKCFWWLSKNGLRKNFFPG